MMHYLLILLIGYLLSCSNMAVYLAAAQTSICAPAALETPAPQRADPGWAGARGCS